MKRKVTVAHAGSDLCLRELLDEGQAGVKQHHYLLYAGTSGQFAGWLSTTEELDTVDATQENISRYMEVLEEEGRSTATQARCVASLRNFYSYLVSSGFLEQSPVTDVKVERKERKLPQILTNRESSCCSLSPCASMTRASGTRPCWRCFTPPVCGCRNSST